MIFLIDKMKTEFEVLVYKSTKDLSNRIDWQDVFEGKSIIIDELGNEYEWDKSKKEEIGTVFNYTLIRNNRISNLTNMCITEFQRSENKTEFSFKIKDN